MVIMGKVVAAHGIRGALKILPYTEYPNSLLDYAIWQLGDGQRPWRPLEVRHADVRGRMLVAQLQSIDDRTAAERYKGQLVAVPRKDLPEPDENEYYWSDLLGMQVLDPEGILLGTVHSLLETGANDVLVVHGDSGEELLIPFIASVVREVDAMQKTIRVDWRADYLK